MSDALLHRLESVVAQLEKVATKLGGAGGSSGHSDEKAVPPAVAAYDDLIARSYKPFFDNCQKIECLHQIGHDAESALLGLRKVIDASFHCKKPSDKDMMKLLEPVAKVVEKYQSPDNRSPFFHHQKAFGETIQLCNWVVMPGPGAYVGEACLQQADFYLIKVLGAAKDAADGDKQTLQTYVKQIKALLADTSDYIKEYFKMGLVWNAKGVDVNSYHGGAAPAGVPAGVPPPPPGGAVPPPPPFIAGPDLSSSAPAPAPAAGSTPGGMAAVFSELSKGENITSGLKKVTADMKSKNLKDLPTLEPKSKAPAAAPARSHKVAEVAKPPSLELRQGTWFCENYVEDVEIKDIEMRQSVYILKAKNCSVSIPEKCKSIQLDGCSKARVVFSQVVSSFEAVNCDRVSIVISENCPSVAIDKCSGIQIILTENSVKAPPNIVTSSATELNLVVPGAKPEDDPIEMPLPHQFITVFKDGKVVTEPVSHSGA